MAICNCRKVLGREAPRMVTGFVRGKPWIADGLAVFGANRGSRQSADGPGHPRMIHLMQNSLPCIVKATS